MQKPIAIDLFSGCGGLSLGLEAAGFAIHTAVEFEPVHAVVHHFNFPGCNTICTDISEYDPEPFEREISVISFGSPCQSFSKIGLQDPSDARANLSFEAVRIILKLRPRYLIMENVPNILSHKHVHVLESVISKLGAGGYKIVKPLHTLNSQDFGVAQKRERLFVLGYREDCPPPEYPVGTGDRTTAGDVLLDLSNIPEFIGNDLGIDAQILKNHTILTGTKTYNKLGKCESRLGLDRIWGHLGSYHSIKVRDRFLLAPQGKKEAVSRFHKLDPNGLALTQRAGTPSRRGNHTASRPIHFHHPRCLTIREGARLHGYPDWFQFHRTIHAGFRQIGNSVCPPVAQAIGEEIAKVLEPEKQEDKLLSLNNQNAALYFSVNPLKCRTRAKKTA